MVISLSDLADSILSQQNNALSVTTLKLSQQKRHTTQLTTKTFSTKTSRKQNTMITALGMDQIATEMIHPNGRRGREAMRTRIGRWKSYFGCSPIVAADIWNRLEANGIRRNNHWVRPKHLLYALMLGFKYATDEAHATLVGCHVDTFRKWAWFIMEHVYNMHDEVVREQ